MDIHNDKQLYRLIFCILAVVGFLAFVTVFSSNGLYWGGFTAWMFAAIFLSCLAIIKFTLRKPEEKTALSSFWEGYWFRWDCLVIAVAILGTAAAIWIYGFKLIK